MLKRLFDVAAASAGIVIASPLMALIAFAIMVESILLTIVTGRWQGGFLFTQMRDGKNVVPFKIYKFRTMLHNSGVPGERLGKYDERFTLVGRWLRPLHFDELPQLFNVLKGDMSMVGPRPLSSSYVAGFLNAKHHSRYTARLAQIQPGLTGLSQIRGRKKHHQVALGISLHYDLHYRRRQSFLYDLYIIGITVFIIGRRLLGLKSHHL
jgi:lipopolysaccharide/colanic/teichoic acid biosynthesis glycosyltransferase